MQFKLEAAIKARRFGTMRHHFERKGLRKDRVKNAKSLEDLITFKILGGKNEKSDDAN